MGGYFALKHYHDYRITHDVDAWWAEESRESDREQVRAALKTVLESLASEQGLAVNRRRFGDTESWELLRPGSKVFSFQIASRTLRLEPSVPSPWPPLLIETFADNVASKMTDPLQREQADYLHRVCAQWDYGIIPEPDTFRLLAQWREVFDRFPLSHSAAYHTFRFRFGWEPVPGRALRASYEVDDLREGRTDPCALYT